jgi:hypothetical protein
MISRPGPRRPRRLVGVGVSIASVAAILIAVTAYFLVRHHVSRASLSDAVAGQFGGFADCEQRGSFRWRCNATSTDESDGFGPYDVRVAGHCWRGTLDRTDKESNGPPKIAGCIGILDQLRISDRLGLTALAPPPGFY